MPHFGQRSLMHLHLLHPDLQRVCNAAIVSYDFTIICSVRSRYEQMQAYYNKRSKAKFGQSPHNYFKALAFDAIPYPFTDDWDDLERFTEMANVICETARYFNVKINWGGTWPSFKDYPHFELTDWLYIVENNTSAYPLYNPTVDKWR